MIRMTFQHVVGRGSIFVSIYYVKAKPPLGSTGLAAEWKRYIALFSRKDK
jgi:hypothetical protein